jgi:peroxiredoxin
MTTIMNKNIFESSWKLALAIGLICLLILPVGCQSLTENSGTELINRPAPDFTLKDLDGNGVQLSALLGKTVVMNFWSTTCPPCVAEMPIFQELYAEWSGRSDVVFLSLNLGEDAAKVRSFMQARNFTFPVLLDSNWDAAGLYQIRYTPTTCLVDSQGYLKFAVVGAFKDRAALDKQLSVFISVQP